jgi:hypothetical protein
MSEQSLTDFERKALQALLSAANGADEQLRQQIDALGVKHRESTVIGLFVEFDVPDELATIEKNRKVFSNLVGEMNGLKNGFGGVLYVENGKIHTLEFFTYDEDWPADPSGYTLHLNSIRQR